MSPHRQTIPAAAGILVCPNSPAAPTCAALQHAAGDDAGTQAGGGLDEQHVVEAVPLPAPLGEHDDVGVVVEADRRAGQLA